MNQKLKRMLSMILALALIISMCPGLNLTAFAADNSSPTFTVTGASYADSTLTVNVEVSNLQDHIQREYMFNVVVDGTTLTAPSNVSFDNAGGLSSMYGSIAWFDDFIYAANGESFTQETAQFTITYTGVELVDGEHTVTLAAPTVSGTYNDMFMQGGDISWGNRGKYYTADVNVVPYTLTVGDAGSSEEDTSAYFTVSGGTLVGYTGPGGDVVIPSDLGITRITEEAFKGNTTITSLVIPEGVTSMSSQVFMNCSKLASLTLPSTLTEIPSQMCWSNYALTEIVIPEGVVKIHTSAFDGCSKLTSVTLPNTLQYIYGKVFKSCAKLTSIDIPDSVIYVSNEAFDGAGCVETVDNVKYTDGWALDEVAGAESYTLRDGTRGLAYMAFYGNKTATSVTLPASLEYLNDYSLGDCTNLVSITFLGDAPTADSVPFGEGFNKECVVYYYEGAEGFTETWNKLPTVMLTEGGEEGGEDGGEDTDDGLLYGGETLIVGGTYQLAPTATGTITISTTEAVTIIGNGAQWNDSYTMTSTANAALNIVCTVAGTALTIQDLYATMGSADSLIDFVGTGNKLTIAGINVLENENANMNNAVIHVPSDGDLTLDGDGTAYIYKSALATAIGGDSAETNGHIIFNGGTFFVKGTKTGAVIGAGGTAVGGPITINGGNLYVMGNARGACLGGGGYTGGVVGTGGAVTITGGNVMLVVNWSGASIGGGGGNSSAVEQDGGVVNITGGSLKVRVNSNAYSQWGLTAAENDPGYQINDVTITAEKLNGAGEAVYLLPLSLDGVTANAEGDKYVVTVDGKAFYSGNGYANTFSADTASTVANWPAGDPENNLYLYLTGKDHTIDVNGTAVTYYWDEVHETFDTVDKAVVTFAVDPADANIVISDGIGYTYLENTHEGRFFEAVEADEENGIVAEAAVTKFALVPGEYTFTITKDGYYASTGSFKVSDALHAVSIASSSNINSYLKDDVVTIPMTAFVKSTNEGAWDGVTIDVSWYSEAAKQMHISTPAQLAGMAAIVNGIYNAEITTIIDDVNADGVTEAYTPYDYAHLEGRKIIAANSGGSTGSNNLVTTSTYWYGAKSEGSYISGSDELAMPSDFRGQTVYIDCDLDMGGYQTSDGVWTGARYMTIGGQSLMHYIDYSEWMSDGYSHIGSSFNGTLDGQGHIIKNMYCDRYATGANYGDSVSVALVGRLGNHDGDPADMAVVDPTLRNIAVTGYVYGRRSVGGIVGKTGQTSASKFNDGSTGAIIENCVNFAEVRNTDSKGVGGICGAGWNKGVIRNCANFGYIYAAYKNAGGISGSCEVPVINCYNVGYVDAISYNYAQAIGTDNGGAVYTNVYWLTGSSLADSDDSYQYPAVYRHDSKDTLYEIETFDGFKTADFLANLNGNYRGWVFAAETDAISAILAGTTFQNCKLETTVTDEAGETESITAAGFPVPRCFITDATTLTGIEKTSDPADLEYIEGQSFDTTGLEIWATWSDGTKELVEDYVVSPEGALGLEDTTVTVSGTRGGQEYSYSFAVTVTPNALERIAFRTQPSNLLYCAGEAPDITGMTINAYYSNAPTTAVMLDPEDYTTEFVTNEDGTTELVVSYTYKDVTMTLSVAVTIMDTPAPTLNAEGYYELGCTNDVLWFANQVNKVGNTEINGKVIADITMGEDFVGIGTSSKLYAGTFDGGNYTVTLTTNTSSSYSGLLACVSGATVKNVIVDGSVTSSSSTTGIAGVVGYVYKNGATIVDCVNKAAISGTTNVGGIVGKMQTNSLPVTVSNCRNEGTISSTGTQAGGIVGYMISYSTGTGLLIVTDCVNTGAVTSTSYNVGGIVGYMSSASADVCSLVQNCANEAPVNGKYNVGGIVGQSYTVYDQINACYNLGDVTSTYGASQKPVGGIVGYLKGSVKNVYNLGRVNCVYETAVAGAGIGGVVGMTYAANTSVENAYNAGTVTAAGSGIPSGILGYARYATTLTNCHYLEGTANVAVGYVYNNTIVITGEPAAQNDAQLKALAETLGSAFKAANHPCYNNGFPVLVWQADPSDDNLNTHSYNTDGFCDGCGVYNPDAESYTIRTAAALKAIADAVNAGDTLKGKTVTLAANISLADYQWMPIGGAAENVVLEIHSQEELTAAIEKYNMIYDDHGNSYKYGTDKNMTYVEGYVYYYVSGQIFSGTFDGAGFSVTDLNVNVATGYAGFFGNVDGTVKNFTLIGSVTSTANNADFVGGVAGKLSEGGTIQGVTANVTVTANKCYNVGGIVGFLGTKDATASNKFTSANNTFVIECVNNGSVTGYSQVGGITGENAGQIQRCVNTGTINALKTGSKAGIGGIAGRNGCNNNAYTMGTILDCYNTGTIGSASNKWVGGITGFSNAASIVRNCYNIGTVYGAGQANALVGQGEAMPANYAGAGVYNCWYLDSTKVFDASGVYGGHYEDCGSRTEAEMKAPAFAAIMGSAFNVDSANINSGYPVLKFQGGTAAPAIYTVTIPEKGEGYTVSVADGYTTTVVEGGEFKFSIYLLDGYRVVSVKAGETELTAENGVYTIANITSDVVVTIDVRVIDDSGEESLVITGQPVDYVGLVGDMATFTVTAEGEDLTYQWYFSKDNGETWEKSSGTSNTLTIEFKAYRINYQYYCVVTDGAGNTVSSDIVKLTAQEMELAIVTQPESYVGAVNDNVTFTVEATGNGLVYEWFYSDNGGETWAKSYSTGHQTNTLAPVLRAHRDGYMYKCVVTDIFGNSVTSEIVSMTVKASDVIIVTQPADVKNAVLNQLYTFTVEATGDNLTCRWQVSTDGGETWEDSWNQGYNTATLSVRMNANRDGNLYRCVVTSGLKTVAISDAAILDLQDPSAEIISQSGNITVLANETATFTVEAEGTDLTYLWYRSDDKGATWTQTYLSGYNTDTLSFVANTNRAAMYMCKVTDGSGKSVWSEPVKLQILSAELKILTQPESVICAVGETAVFTVEAQGDILKYQWFASADGETWTPSYLTGYNTAEFSFVVNTTRAAKQYKCVITDAADNTVETNAVSVTIG